MWSKLFVLSALAALVAGGHAPNANRLQDFRESPLGSSLPDSIYEDAALDVPGLISKYGYPAETHTVTTSDGYILTAHRIPRGRDRHDQPGNRPAVFLMHGLLSSSADFVLIGPGKALAYLLAEEGYDVWMGNARGNYYSRKHHLLNPDISRLFWRFSWEEIGLYDLSAFVDYVLEVTGEKQLDYVGHSQGGTSFLVLNSLRPEYNAKFRSFHGLAPASYFNNNDHPLFKALARYEKIFERTARVLGIGEILTQKQGRLFVEYNRCGGASVFDPTCVATLQERSAVLKGYNSSMIPLFLSHSPAGSSVGQLAHFGQVLRRGVFARFDHSKPTNFLRYGRFSPPEFDVSKITVPTYLYYGMADTYVHYKDLLALSVRMGNTKQTFRVSRPEFNHFDFIWGNDVKDELYDVIIVNLKKLD